MNAKRAKRIGKKKQKERKQYKYAVNSERKQNEVEQKASETVEIWKNERKMSQKKFETKRRRNKSSETNTN